MEATYARDTWDAVRVYTYTDGENRTPGETREPLPNRPKHAATLRVKWGPVLASGLPGGGVPGRTGWDAGANLAYEDLATIVGLG